MAAKFAQSSEDFKSSEDYCTLLSKKPFFDVFASKKGFFTEGVSPRTEVRATLKLQIRRQILRQQSFIIRLQGLRIRWHRQF